MEKNLFEIVCAKDENAARQAISKILNDCKTEEFEKLCEKMDFLFDFVKENVYKRFSSVINSSNYKNIFKFFNYYSPYFDDFFASVLAKYANEDLTDEILEILHSGNDYQKAYAASYFKKIPDTAAKEDLVKNLSTDFEPLFLNCAEALGKMESYDIYDKYIQNLSSDDEFVKYNAVKFLTAFGDKKAVLNLIEAMKNSPMSENMAGDIAALISPTELFEKDFSLGAVLFNNLINGLGEILPLENIFYFEVYDIVRFLFSNTEKPESSLILFSLKNKFDLFTQNDEYIFDLDKNSKQEILEIKDLLFSKDNKFWNDLKNNLKMFIKPESAYLQTVLEIIKEQNYKDFVSEIIELTNSYNETVIIEALETLKYLDSLDKVDKSKINIKNDNLKAILEQLYIK